MSSSRKKSEKRTGKKSSGGEATNRPDPGTLPGRPLSRRRLWLFRLIAVSFPLVVLLLAEVAFRIIPGLNEDRDPYVNISPVSVFSRTTIRGQEYYNITHPLARDSGRISILVKKPANTIRIFCLGSSACAGWPHPPTETFSAYLQQALQTAYPGKTVEVVNAAAHGFAAYRTRRVLDEVIQMEPDGIIVWEGNNEFMEDRNYDPPNAVVLVVARHLRTVQWLRSLTTNRTKMSGAEMKDAAQFFWKKTRQQSLRLRQDPAQYAAVQEHFRESCEHMVRESQRHHVPLVLCTVPVNLRDWLPTVSFNRLTGDPLQQWQRLYNHARRDLLEGHFQDGIQTMRRAIALESEHAESYFWLGRLLEADGQRPAAWEAFSRARDQDYNPFRAISSFNESIRLLAKQNQNQGVYLLDLERFFAEASRQAAPGFDLFLDYVHPTKPANMMIAEKAYALLTHGGVLRDRPAVEQFIYHELPFGPGGEPYRDEADDALQEVRLVMAEQNRQYETIVHITESLVKRLTGQRPTGPNDPMLARCSPEQAEGYRVSWNYVDV
jgi:tetratricopeptide (TPR) repeat protein